MICCTSVVSRSLSFCIRPANRCTASGSSAASWTASASRFRRPDRGLQLVGDVGDEVPADRLDPSLAGAVLDQRQHQPAAQRGDARRDVQRRDRASAGHHQLGLPDLPVPADLADEVGELLHGDLAALHQPIRVRRRGGLDHLVVRRRRPGRCSAAPQDGGDARRGRRPPRRPGARCICASLTRQARTTPPPSTAPSSANRSACVVASTARSYAGRHRSFASTRALTCAFVDCSPRVHAPSSPGRRAFTRCPPGLRGC